MIAGIILAAGASSRMGQPKQLLDWGGVPLLRHVVQQALAARLDTLYVVLGANSTAVAAALEGLPVQLIQNERYAEGQSSSVRAGIAALPPSASAALILLADQPLVTPQLIDALIDAAQQSPALIVAPRIGGRRSNPVLFKAALFPALQQLSGDQGARELIAAHGDEVLLLPYADPAAAADIDTPADYQGLRPPAAG